VTSPAQALVERLRPLVGDERVLAAIAAVPRDAFVPRALRDRAWDNEALPIWCGQTISQPLVVARMCALLHLRGDERVLDVGTGSGYHAAVLAHLAREVFSVEVFEELTEHAREALGRAGITGVHLVVGDGARGLPAEAPFDAVNVAAAGTAARLEPLLEQLAPGGRLVAPVTTGDGDQVLVTIHREASGRFRRAVHERVRFVPLVGPRRGGDVGS
jgi:protein-L-isoaspartate(D-aspartate) O-methyltransferase